MDRAESLPAKANWRKRLEELYSRQYATALRLAVVLTGDRESAEDVVQDAFVRVFVRFQDRKPPEAIEAYLRRTIVNLTHSRVRQIIRDRRRTEQIADLDTDRVDDLSTTMDAWASLMQLPVRQRTAIFLRYYEGRSELETADALACSVGAVKSLVRRGTKTLRMNEGETDE